jgi:PIN domain nuclease of toxin-antitoxin system
MNTLLVDTHLYIWARVAPRRLSRSEIVILRRAAKCFVSAASLWEIAILGSLGRIDRIDDLIAVAEPFELLPIEPEHGRELAELPMHHRDPFDRMLIAQARYERLALLTRNSEIRLYADSRLRLAE